MSKYDATPVTGSAHRQLDLVGPKNSYTGARAAHQTCFILITKIDSYFIEMLGYLPNRKVFN